MDDYEMELDNVLKAAWPYLIFPEDEFRSRLAGMVHAMFRNYLGRSETFYETANSIMRTIETRPQYDSDRENLISSFDIRVFSFFEHVVAQKRQIADIQRRLAKVEGLVKRGAVTRGASKMPVEPKIHVEPKMPVEPKRRKGARQYHSEYPCPNCGRPLRKAQHNFDALRRLYCHASNGGCGNKYKLQDDGSLIPGDWPSRGGNPSRK